jgi:CRP-like cAMP-binding protein
MPQAPPIDKPVSLRRAVLLRDFTDVGVKILAEIAEQRSVGQGTFAFKAGDASDTLSFVAEGTLHTVGGMALLVEGEHLLSALAATDVELLEISRAAFEEMKRTHPRTALKLTLALAQDLAERLREAKGPLREFLVWQISKRQSESR